MVILQYLRYGVVATCIAAGGVAHASTLRAQAPAAVRRHLREMATGTRNAQAGEQPLDSLNRFMAYVPQQAVGTRRVPLVVFIHGGGVTQESELMETARPLADKYGVIALVAPSITPVSSKEVGYALGQFAIDPEKIAVIGMSNGGDAAMYSGCHYSGVFGRVAALTPVPTVNHCNKDEGGPLDSSAQFLVSVGLGEADKIGAMLDIVRELRADGHAVTPVFQTRGHTRRLQDFDYAMGWFRESWTMAGTAPAVVVDSGPILTMDRLQRLADFWASLESEPDSVVKTGRIAYQKARTIPVALERLWVSDMLDMPAFAAAYPSVAAKLQAAGLSAQEEQADWTAFVSAMATHFAIRYAGDKIGSVPPASILGRNLAFVREHLKPSLEATLYLLGTSSEKAAEELKAIRAEYPSATMPGFEDIVP